MKTLLLIVAALMSNLCCSLAGDEEIKLPDLAKAFPEQKVMQNMEIAGSKTCLYATDLEFAELQKMLQKFLGEGWAEEKLEGAAREVMEEAFKAQGMKVMGVASYTNPDFPEKMLMLTQLEMPVEGKKSMAQIVLATAPGVPGPE